MVQTVVVIIIILIAIVYIVRKSYKILTGKKSGCGCSADTCGSCPFMTDNGCTEKDEQGPNVDKKSGKI